ncbi:ribosomal protein 60S [Lipomyces kononenkoae]|uniref:Ribosomal protein 60S n=1 Tax=Lipomyces kononenkoae TaxID=34357 RepID=A0ACC3T073_LIPKO
MKYLAAYLLLTSAGKAAPTAEDITAVLSSVGIEPEEDRLASLLSELEGKDINELIAAGSEKLATVPSGGAVAAAAGGAGAAAAPAEAAEEEAAPAEEEKEESDDDMGFGLFD